ncbi:MAG TPA: DUF4288 domain-containing protein [Tepidisphaeraceae bacterium]|nr:DUF4288 domain-containing protein [Tepidisphaeraceae bacterium]
MAYIPPNAKWYLADLVEQIRVEGDSRIVVHVNTLLVRADSPEQAYEEAIRLGRENEQEYENGDNKLVRITFRGLRDLNVIHDELEHGAELAYSEDVVGSEQEVQSLVRNRSDLAIFAERHPSAAPNYVAKWIIEKLREGDAEGLPDIQ